MTAARQLDLFTPPPPAPSLVGSAFTAAPRSYDDLAPQQARAAVYGYAISRSAICDILTLSPPVEGWYAHDTADAGELDTLLDLLEAGDLPRFERWIPPEKYTYATSPWPWPYAEWLKV